MVAADREPTVPSFFVIRGNDQGCRFELEATQVSLGRDATNRVQLHDTEVSRRHAELLLDGRQHVIKDLGSSNGTYVNGRRVAQHALQSGDQVQLGRSLLLYTGGNSENGLDLDQRVQIVSSSVSPSESRIVRAISQEEGSRIFQLDEVGAQSPWLARARSNLQIMYRTALAVSHTLDIDQLLHRILELIFEWVEADRGCIMLVDPDGGHLQPAALRDRQGRRAEAQITISQTILDYVLEHREGVLTSDAQEDDRWNAAASIVQQGVHEAICVPMQGRYDVVGVIYIDTSTPPDRVLQRAASKFHAEHLKLMIAIAHQAALAVEDTRYYSAMVQAERLAAMGQTIAMLSHHIKNILQGIRGGSYLIEMGLGQHDEALVRKGWGMVERRQEQISNLVLDMLTFSKEREPDLAPADLNATVADVCDLMQSRAEELGVTLHWHPAEGLPTLTFDAEGIHRAVLNVVTNAIDACEQQSPGRVDVSTELAPDGSSARVIVQDNGNGIPPEDLERIFSLFVSNKGSRGTGLGLPVSQKILQEHGGAIRVESEPGRGTRFLLELPCHAAEEPCVRETLTGSATDPSSGEMNPDVAPQRRPVAPTADSRPS